MFRCVNAPKDSRDTKAHFRALPIFAGCTEDQLGEIDRRGFNTLLDDLPSLSRSMLKGMASRMAELEDELHQLKTPQA